MSGCAATEEHSLEIFNPSTPPRLSGQASISYEDSPGEHHPLDQEVNGKSQKYLAK